MAVPVTADASAVARKRNEHRMEFLRTTLPYGVHRSASQANVKPLSDLLIHRRVDLGGRMRPHIVFFGEIPLEMERIQTEIQKATLMIVVGTSGSVYPASSFVHWARQGGARTVYVGPEPPLNASAFTYVVEGKAGEVLPGLFGVE